MAAGDIKGLSLVVWLLDEMGADVNATTRYGETPIHHASSLDILTALLDRGADPTLRNGYSGWNSLMLQVRHGIVENVARLLQDPGVRASVNVQDIGGETALHHACRFAYEPVATSILNLLLQAGSDPNLTNYDGQTSLALLRYRHPSHLAAIALLEQYPVAKKDAEKASLLVKARRLIVAANSNIVAPSCLHGRVARGQPLPRVQLPRAMPPRISTSGQTRALKRTASSAN